MFLFLHNYEAGNGHGHGHNLDTKMDRENNTDTDMDVNSFIQYKTQCQTSSVLYPTSNVRLSPRLSITDIYLTESIYVGSTKD
jgi:hypothetical protein